MKIDVERLAARLVQTVARQLKPLQERLAAIEGREPERGEKGDPGNSVTVEDILAALEPVIEARMAHHLLELERRAFDVLQRAIERIPQPRDGEPGPIGPAGPAGPAGPQGERGMDGLGFDDLEFDQRDDGRTIVLRLARGDVVKEAELHLPVVLYRGIYRDGAAYDAGDAVTWGGSLWIALRHTSAKPGDGSADWRLAVKKGRDGRDASK